MKPLELIADFQNQLASGLVDSQVQVAEFLKELDAGIREQIAKRKAGPEFAFYDQGKRRGAMVKFVSLPEQIQKLVQVHGGYRKAGLALGISYAHLHNLKNRKKVPTDETLVKLGLEPVAYYVENELQ